MLNLRPFQLGVERGIKEHSDYYQSTRKYRGAEGSRLVLVEAVSGVAQTKPALAGHHLLILIFTIRIPARLPTV